MSLAFALQGKIQPRERWHLSNKSSVPLVERPQSTKGRL